MIRNIKIHNIFDIIGISKFMELNKYIQKNLWKYSFKCFLWFFKVQWVQKNQGVTFLMVSPKDKIACDHHTLRAFFLLLPCVRVYEYDVSFFCMELCMFGDMYSKYRISNWYVLHEAVAYNAKIIQALDYCDCNMIVC
jgi:hypothetical protein